MKKPTSSTRSIAIALLLAAAGGACLGTDPPPPPPAVEAAAAEAPPGFELGGDASQAKETYHRLCSSCHGAEGKGDGAMGRFLDPRPKDLTDAGYMKTRSDYQVYLAIREGGRAVGLSDKMAAWGKLLTDPEIRDLAAYVRTLSAASSEE